MADPLILAFDTSAAHCAAALLSGDRVLAEVQEDMARGQAEALVPMLAALLAGAGHGWRDLAALAVGTGPGNFTGIRISVAAARGLALGLRIPAIGVSLFEAAAETNHGPALVVLPAPRGAHYAQRFDGPSAAGAPWYAEGDRPDGPGALIFGSPARPAPAIGRIAAARLPQAAPGVRPAPLYVRPADAAPPTAAPPVILP